MSHNFSWQLHLTVQISILYIMLSFTTVLAESCMFLCNPESYYFGILFWFLVIEFLRFPSNFLLPEVAAFGAHVSQPSHSVAKWQKSLHNCILCKGYSENPALQPAGWGTRSKTLNMLLKVGNVVSLVVCPSWISPTFRMLCRLSLQISLQFPLARGSKPLAWLYILFLYWHYFYQDLCWSICLWLSDTELCFSLRLRSHCIWLSSQALCSVLV